MARIRNGTTSSRFRSGDKVRVKRGVHDPDFPDIPLGGWAGTVKEVERAEGQVTYLIAWDRATLRGMHPVYRKRCARDGLELETMWLADEDLEPDDGTYVPIEQPTSIITETLSEEDEDDRVRKALGLTHDDPLPEVSRTTLLAYYRYLIANLKFPFRAYCEEEEIGPFSRKRVTVTVTGLLDPTRGAGLSLEDGLVCTGRDRDGEIEFPLCDIEVKKRDSNFKLISDYAYWFHNAPGLDDGDWEREEFAGREEPGIAPPSLWRFTKTALVCGIGGVLLGAAIGAAIGAIRGAGLAAVIGGIPLAAVGTIVLGYYGFFFGAVNRLRSGPLLGAALGLVGGGLIGMVAGLMVVSLPWSVLGFLAGMFLGPYVLPQQRRRSLSLQGAFLGTCGGILVSAFRHDRPRATSGAVPGSIAGLLVAVGLVLLLGGVLYLRPRTPTGYDDTNGKDDEIEDEG